MSGVCAAADACLHTISLTYFDGADKTSCTWVDHNEKLERTRELLFALGVNSPSMYSSTINMGKQVAAGDKLTCSVTREFEVFSKEYELAYFSAVGNGEVDELGPNDGDPLPGRQQPDASCVVERPATKCNYTLHHTPKLQWAISSREFWTTNKTIMAQLDKGDEECLANKKIRCVPAKPPFRYSVKITEHPCAPGKPIPKVIKAIFCTPEAMPNYRQTGFKLDYVIRAKWRMKAEKPIYLIVGPSDKLLKVCPPGPGQVCNYKEAYKKYAYKAHSCYGTACSGLIIKPLRRDVVIMLAYPKFLAEEQAVMPASTPQQIVEFYMDAWESKPPAPG
ncbi:hypothetical protein C2E20_8492 [Micractinium conductrix]|uniref:Uncharacterized protein n=1 Tax=Micractinium conductrix TaxID=554055 RepID=A0A2P6V1B6_9CHLO|nr:hypothetical protein C2E20_8492 [Micractinium conductrix]|eukprot:PSC67875.1 hypothetical protein C2E20_8492 [Micractinium conductrix]